ncbi:YDG domain-containing protein, partial [Synechococcus sp. CCY9202]|uniref:YDG domain-containing protein n=1 Tax=Synechococcus sp. CCY9202 TaxID=174698 RepID=UPI002B2176B5
MRIESGGYSNVMVGVINSLGSFIDKPVSLSSKGNLFWLSPGGITISGSGGFQNVQHLNLSTATALRIGSGLFDVLGTTPAQAALLSGEPLRGRSGLVTDSASLAALGLSSNGDLSLAGGTLTVDQSLLMDAQGGNVILQAARLLVSGGEIEVAGRDVSISSSELNVSSADGVGGRIAVEGEVVSVRDSRIDSSGATGGGTVVLAAVGDLTLENTDVLATGGDGDGGEVASEPESAGDGAGNDPATIVAAAEEEEASASEAGSDGSETGGSETGGSEAAADGASETGLETSDADSTDAPEAGPDVASEGSAASASEPSSEAMPEASSGAAWPSGAVIVAEAGSRDSGPADAGSSDPAPSAPVGVAATAASTPPPAVADGIPAKAVLADGGRIELKGQRVLISGGMINASGSGSAEGSTDGGSGTVVENSGTSGSWSFAPQTGTTDLNAALAEPPPDAVTVVETPLLEAAVLEPLASQVSAEDMSTVQAPLVTEEVIASLSNDVSALDVTAVTAAAPAAALLAPSTPLVSPTTPSTTAQAPPASGRGGQVTIAGGTVLQSGAIRASGSSGGSVVLTAAETLMSSAEVRATGSAGNGGVIQLEAGGNVIQSAASVLQASGTELGGSITVSAGRNLFSSGTYEAIGTGEQAQGGSIEISGTTIQLQGASADASGDGGGGSIQVGGGFRGAALPSGAANARSTTVTFSTTLNADATGQGDGGTVIVWSDDTTRFYGSVSAKGGLQGGDGGLLEVSGKELLTFGGTADASAPKGKAGTLLLDPKNIIIDASATPREGIYLVTDLVDPNPVEYGGFGRDVLVLSGGNILAFDPADDAVAADAGAVYLFNGQTGALLSTLHGSNPDDQVGNFGAVELSNGNFVVLSPDWDAPSDSGLIAAAGAVTWGHGTTGVSGAVSSTNSLVGSNEFDNVGLFGVTPLSNGNYVVNSPYWDAPSDSDLISNAGAVTWGNGATGISGAVSSTNSLVGSSFSNFVGLFGVTPLSNGNYVVNSPYWDAPSDSGLISNAGAVTWGNGSVTGTRTVGVVSSENSLVGSLAGDQVGFGGVTALSNGNYVVASTEWNSLTASNVGAVTWGNGSVTGERTAGVVSSENSLVGSNTFDLVGAGGVTALSNGNYVVSSPDWNAPSRSGLISNAGAVTWGDGATGISGAVSSTNSLVGSNEFDDVGLFGVTPLSNGNYVVNSPSWNAPSDSGLISEAGAVTWGNGSVTGTRTTGEVSSENSLVGSLAGDRVGLGGVTALSNGNYVVASHEWNSLTASNVGAVTWGNGSGGTVGEASAANSLVGSNTFDYVGIGGVTALSNGNYVVNSYFWDAPSDSGLISDAGAVTWGNGSGGTVGEVSAANSLVGSNTFDYVGISGVTALSNGNYVVSSDLWNAPSDSGLISDAGAVTWGNGSGGTVGEVNDTNSLVGSTTNDRIGSFGVVEVGTGNYVLISPSWNDPFGSSGYITNAGAVTWGNSSGSTVGAVTAANSLVGSFSGDQVGSGGVTVLSNGNFVVSSPFVDASSTSGLIEDAGAVTWGDGSVGLSGPATSLNSLLGTQPYQGYGTVCGEGCESQIIGLDGDRFVVGSPSTDSATAFGVGLLQVAEGNIPSGMLGSDQILTPAQIEAIANSGTDVILQANNDITLTPASDINIDNPEGIGGSLSLQAGRSIVLNSSITTDGSDVSLLANDPLADFEFRDSGEAEVWMGEGTRINTGTGNIDIKLSPSRYGEGESVDADAGNVTLQALSGSTVRIDAQTDAGNTISLNEQISASFTNDDYSASDSIVLNIGEGSLLNNGGDYVLSVDAEFGARWLVYAAEPSEEVNALPRGFKQYGKVEGDRTPIAAASGNGVIYGNSPIIEISLEGSVSKTYDGTPDSTLEGSSYVVTGILDGDNVDFSLPGSGLFVDLEGQGVKNVGTGINVQVSGLAIVDEEINKVFGYQLASETITGAIGEIKPKALTVTLSAQSKEYDGTTTAELASEDFQLTGFVDGEGGNLQSLPTEGQFNSKDVLAASRVSAELTAENYQVSRGTSLDNYSVDTSAEGDGSITPKALTVTLSAQSKEYDGTTTAE